MPRKFKEARQINKLKVIEAAAKLGVSQPTLSAWEGERKSPGLDHLENMADLYGVSTVICLAAASRVQAIRMFPFQSKLCAFFMESQYGRLSMAGYWSMPLTRSFFP